MTGDAVPDGRRTAIDLASSWLALPGSAAAPARAISALELDGYLTGVIVAPSLIRPRLWMTGLWADEGPVFDNGAQMQSALSSVGIMFNTLSARIDRSLRRLEAEHVCDYRPAFQATTSKPSHDAIKTWVRGFWRAMTLAPTEWQALAADERTQVAVMPFVGFIDSGPDETFEPADDIENRLDDAAAQIPRAILLLRKIAQLRASRTSSVAQARRSKLGRNDPCPCGSAKKYKRCCGQP